ncbi:MAG: hypothetical protein V3U76_06365 [Granulosicoccus sp.]
MIMHARILSAQTDALIHWSGRVHAIASLRLFTLLVLLLYGGSACAFEFRDLWQTPEQRAAEQLERGENEALLKDAPDADWQGLAHYRDGDFDNATRAWAAGTAEADSQEVDAEVDAVPAALSQSDEDRQYNLATAETRVGNYSRALELFDGLLEKGADQPDVANNRAVAEQLYDLQQKQQQQDEEEGKGEQGEQGEGENTNADGEKVQPEDSDSEAKAEKQTMEEEQSPQSDKNDESDSEQDSTDRDAGDKPQNDASKLADALDEQDDQEAAEALAAEAGLQGEKEASAKAEQGDGDMMEADDREPLTEQEQAIEQWLRRIPDDPSGLLRRKLERSHGTNYPEVNDGAQAW